MNAIIVICLSLLAQPPLQENVEMTWNDMKWHETTWNEMLAQTIAQHVMWDRGVARISAIDSCESVIEELFCHLWKLSGRCCRIQSLKARSSCMSHVTWLKTWFWNKDSTRTDRAIRTSAYICCLYSIRMYSNLISIQRWSYHGKLPQDVL